MAHSEEGGDKWIFYHMPIKCRGNFVRLILEECDIDYIDAYGFKNMDGVFRSPMWIKKCTQLAKIQTSPNNDNAPHLIPDNKNILKLKNRIWEPYGCPFLVNFDNPSIALSQTPMIVQYLSNRYGLRPKSDIDHYRAGMIMTNCNDLFDIIKGQSKDSLTKLMKLLQGKVTIFLGIISKPLCNRLYYFDNRITQADLALFNIIDCLHELFGDNQNLLNEFIWNKYPNLKAHYLNIRTKSNGIEKLMKRQKENDVTWWPYYADMNDGIAPARKLLIKYANSKL